jgi:hypothetical protein
MEQPACSGVIHAVALGEILHHARLASYGQGAARGSAARLRVSASRSHSAKRAGTPGGSPSGRVS